ncbi:hypothetical protein L1987_61971 [Smallanthus sonchifolius]|uniref:Uncharacterized protein n=1 Tax=Smallanthus sonchifolius TaxID=185202 RepID=A0ACB9C965_9ASTR|nr:hypothetical protein L1987_61971 [Smallanthus sonchifolius]
MADDRDAIKDLRVQREVDRIVNDQNLVGIRVRLDENNIRHLTATVDGPASTPYEGGIFKIDINLPDAYPFGPPHVRFITKIWHPNISHQSGAVRMSILANNEWSSTMGLKTVLIALQALLSEPDLNEPLEEYYRASKSSFISNARYYTEKYAMERDPPPQLTTRASGTRVTRIPKRLNDFLL